MNDKPQGRAVSATCAGRKEPATAGPVTEVREQGVRGK